VRVTPETPHATADGTQHYFCSEHCRGQFLASHEKHQR
jgi:YHS domain-containing protein